MTTNKQMIDVAEKMATALEKLTDGLAKDGVALDGFVDALAVQEEWVNIKLKREFERFIRQMKLRELDSQPK